MQKIISLFKRNYDGDRLVRDEIVEGAEWVQVGEGVATVKFDGTCCLVRDGILYKRYDAKKGKTPPAGFEPAQEPDPITGHWPGWLPVSSTAPEDRWHREAFSNFQGAYRNGTYELVGPKVQGNPYGLIMHELLRHGEVTISTAPRSFDALARFFVNNQGLEGLVWHHPDGRMVKIKRRDFGLPWPQRA